MVIIVLIINKQFSAFSCLYVLYCRVKQFNNYNYNYNWPMLSTKVNDYSFFLLCPVLKCLSCIIGMNARGTIIIM